MSQIFLNSKNLLSYYYNYNSFIIIIIISLLLLYLNIKRDGVRWVPIIDAGIKYKGDSGEKGRKQRLFIKSSITKKALIGCVWPKAANYMDFNNPLSEKFWIEGLKNITEVYNGPQPSGIWLDMNDPMSFTTNEEGQVLKPEDCDNLDNTQEKNEL